MSDALDLFAGCGGATLGLHTAGHNVEGVEVWPDAVESHRNAGHPCISGDISRLNPRTFGGYDHHHYSPPCTTFSAAGRGRGRLHLDDLAAAVKRVLHGDPHGLDDPDETTLLTLEPARWLHHLRPRTISFEQVRAVLPVWHAYADALTDLGYSTWAGLISAETLGVPQTRVRAWMIARNDGPDAAPPTATHSAYYPRDPDRLDDGVAKWVSMADALGWGLTERPTYTVTAGGGDTGGAEPFGNGARQQMRAAIDRGAWRYTVAAGMTGEGRPRSTEHPAPTVTGKGTAYDDPDDYGRPDWAHRRPATTVCGDPRLAAPGRHDPNESGSQYKDAVRLTVEEALVLQGFPADYPLHGSKTSRFKQVGNAVPPPVMTAVSEALR